MVVGEVMEVKMVILFCLLLYYKIIINILAFVIVIIFFSLQVFLQI